MSVQELIKILSHMDKDKIVIVTDPDGIGWTNIGVVVEGESAVKITKDNGGLFQES